MISEQGAASAAENMIGAVRSISSSMDSFVGAASAGGFRVSQAGGQALLDAINQIEDGLNSAKHNLSTIGQTPQLGTSPGANVTKPFVKKVAGGDEQSFVKALDDLMIELDKAKQGITMAMRNYQETEDAQQQAAGKLQSGA